MNYTHRYVRAAALAAVFMTGALGAGQAMAFGTPGYLIYVEGPNGGQIEPGGGALPFPEGACGMRLKNDILLAWHWHSGDVEPTGDLELENNGWIAPDNELQVVIEFTGPFADDCDGPYVFHAPAPPNSEPPPGAVALSVQFVSPDEVEFLDENFHVFEPPEPPEHREPPDDPEQDFCEQVTVACENPDSYLLDPCSLWWWTDLCDSAEGLSRLALAARQVVEPVILGLSGLQGNSSDAAPLRGALLRAAKGLAFVGPIDDARDDLVRRAVGQVRQRQSLHALSRTAVATSLGSLGLRQCHDRIDSALRLAQASPTPHAALRDQSRRAAASCKAAAQTLSDAESAAMRFTIGLRNEE
ncbi:MAG: hypothetical protein M3461_11190 [Pseudomonadota bacterium]|nr:hypothetical protein [Pseudomonadota bacterium]